MMLIMDVRPDLIRTSLKRGRTLTTSYRVPIRSRNHEARRETERRLDRARSRIVSGPGQIRGLVTPAAPDARTRLRDETSCDGPGSVGGEDVLDPLTRSA